jgi:hypothetical protein
MRYVVHVRMKAPGRDPVFDIVGPFNSLTVADSFASRIDAAGRIRGVRVEAEVVTLTGGRVSPVEVLAHLESIIEVA